MLFNKHYHDFFCNAFGSRLSAVMLIQEMIF